VNIAIIGSGQVGTSLARALERASHQVVFGVRAPDRSKPNERTVASAVAGIDVVILAVPFAAVAEVVEAGSGFAGKIVIDATNPLGMRDGELALTLGFETSGAEKVAALAPSAHVFKTFNQTGFENMADVRSCDRRPVMFVAGDSIASKPTVLRLVDDTGFEAIDAGGLRAARLLEPLAMLWIELARKRGMGSDFAFSLERRDEPSA
jgi:8-hydroxy-5-deazaflavin:NADPH oxidoreductase